MADYQSQQENRPNWLLLAAILLFHGLAAYFLARALAPDLAARIEREVSSIAMIPIEEPVPPPPKAPPAPDEGAQGNPGKRAVARAETAPETPIRNPKAKPAPKASSTGRANNSGANDRGNGTGAAGQGNGTGSGRGGDGSGNGQPPPDLSRKPSVRAGSINTARDFPIPEGGRATRFGKKVEVLFTVTTDGRARNCSIAVNQVDAQAAALVCGLVAQKISFNPALDRSGTPIEARFGYRVTFVERR